MRFGVQADRPVVGIWRDEWLPPSETFIRNQLAAMDTWRPLGVAVHASDAPALMAADIHIFRRRRPAGPVAETGLMLARQRVVNELTARRVRLLHAHFGSGGITARPVAAAAHLPLAVTFHGFDLTRLPHGQGLRARLYRQRLRRVFQDASALVAVSDFIAQRLRDLGAPEDKIAVHRIGIPVGLKTVAERRAEPPSIVFVGRLVEKKGVRDLLTAVALLPEELRQSEVTVIGEGPDRAALEAEALRLRLNVRFTGLMDSQGVDAELAKASVYCGPSRTAEDGDAEGFGMVYLEAAAHSLPTVAYRHGGVPEAIVDGTTGLLADEGDIHDLSRHLATLLGNRQYASKLGKAGRRRVEADFDIRSRTRDLEVLYDAVARQHPSRTGRHA